MSRRISYLSSDEEISRTSRFITSSRRTSLHKQDLEIKLKNGEELVKIFTKLFKEAKFNTIIDIIKIFNRKIDLMENNMLKIIEKIEKGISIEENTEYYFNFDFNNGIITNKNKRITSSNFTELKSTYLNICMFFIYLVENKINLLIINHNKKDSFKDNVSSKILTQQEIDLKENKSSIFKGFDDKFKPLENQLVRLTNIYADYNNTYLDSNKDSLLNYHILKQCYSSFFKKRIEEILKEKYIPLTKKERPILKYYIAYSKLAAFYVYWQTSSYKYFGGDFKRDELLLCNIDRIMVKGYDSDLQPLAGIDVGGVSRDFITDVVNELKESKIFKCLDENDENKEGYYYIDPEFKFNNYFRKSVTFMNGHLSDSKKIDINYEGEQFKINFFKFFGDLLSFLLINEFTIPFKLSSAILSTLVYPEINIFNTTYHHQFYYLYYDKPIIYNSYKVFIKDPLLLKDFTFSANEMITDLVESDYDLTSDNFGKYLEEISKYRFPLKTKPYYQAIADGFNNIVRNCFNIKQTPLSVIDKLISNTKITMEEVKQLKEAFMKNMTERIRAISDPIDNQNTIQITSFFNLILSRPFSVKNQDGDMELLTEDKYLDFISHLLRFWSGWNHFKQTPELKYHIKVIKEKSIDSLPSSHTCFYQIDLPPYKNIQSFLNKLYLVVYNVESGIGLAGGGKKRKNTFTMKKLINKLKKYKLNNDK